MILDSGFHRNDVQKIASRMKLGPSWRDIPWGTSPPAPAFPPASSQTYATANGRSLEMLRKVILALAAGSFAFAATACNTVKGAGKDIESVGQAADDAL
jgi:predicted small secreted protein